MKETWDTKRRERLQDLLHRSRSPEAFLESDRAELNSILRRSCSARREAARWWTEEVALVDELQVGAVHSMLRDQPEWKWVREAAEGAGNEGNAGRRRETGSSWGEGGRWARSWRGSAIAAGILVVLGLGFGSAGWALSVALNAPRIAPLLEGDFQGLKGALAPGFPSVYGRWSGDPAEFVSRPEQAIPGTRGALRFLETRGDGAVPEGRAESCDVFKIVDLRPIKGELERSGEASLELSAWFWDQRERPGVRVAMSCHLYVFEGNPEGLGQVWPRNLSQALATSHELWESEGLHPQRSNGGRRVATRCGVSPRADYAVLHLGTGKARKTESGPELGEIYASDVQLKLRLVPSRGNSPAGGSF